MIGYDTYASQVYRQFVGCERNGEVKDDPKALGLSLGKMELPSLEKEVRERSRLEGDN